MCYNRAMSDDTPQNLRQSQAAATRALILDAAEALFAEKGFSGTSMRAIARQASTSQALLHHHFGTKEGLYEAVKSRFTDRSEALQPPEVLQGGLDLSVMTEIMLGYLRYLDAHPHARRLRQWATLEGDERPWGDEDAVWRRMQEAVIAGQGAGMLSAELDVPLFLAAAASLITGWFDCRAIVCRALELDMTDPRLDRRYIEQSVRVLLFGSATPALQAILEG
jgi:TetR/AcrR family transcriptional regulator